MNEDLKISPHGLRLIQEYEGEPRLKARLCEGNRWELGWGCTYYPDNRPVMEGDVITPDYAPVMLRHAVRVTEEAVYRLVDVPINQFQFDALCGFVFNVGEENARKSTVIRETNNNRIYDAAAAFGMWLYATKNGRKQAYRGLLRRRYAEACLYLGYDWTEACDDEFIRLKAAPPEGGIGTDKVLFKTPWADVLQIAKDYPLAAPVRAPILVPDIIPDTPAAPPQADAKGGAAPVPPNPQVAAPAVQKPAAPVGGPSSAAGPAGPIVAPQPEAPPVSVPKAPPPVVVKKDEPKPPIVAPPLPKDAAPANITDPKDMVLSRRFWGLAVTAVGTTNFLPRGVSEWMNNEGNRELLTWLVVVVVGFAIYKYGQRKASRPLK